MTREVGGAEDEGRRGGWWKPKGWAKRVFVCTRLTPASLQASVSHGFRSLFTIQSEGREGVKWKISRPVYRLKQLKKERKEGEEGRDHSKLLH